MATLIGTSSSDIINGALEADFILGRSGNDEIRGNDGDDFIDGEGGNDTLLGGAGRDRIEGGEGDDSINGGDGDDSLTGENGSDQISGGGGRDSLDGGAGDDILNGGAGDDSVVGGAGNDSILGGGGLDAILGGDGNDTIDAGGGADRIAGGAGQDFITTGNGNDTVTFDQNLLRTGDVDRATRQVTGGEDFLTDFMRGKDVITLDAEAFRIFGELKFVNALAADLPSGGVNFIVLQDVDNDNNPATPFNAGAAANLIAAQIEDAGPGFFVYFNSDLQLNRLVYSKDLSDLTADLQILGRFTNEIGGDAIAALSQFTSGNFGLFNERPESERPVEVELEPGGDVFFVGADDFVNSFSIFGADLDASFNPGRAEVVDFDAATDVVLIDQSLVALDRFVESNTSFPGVQNGAEDTFFTFTQGIGGIGEINSDAQAGKAFVGLEGDGLALYYDAQTDTVNVALLRDVSGNEAGDVIIEFEVDGEDEGIALINALSPANFQIVSPADLAAFTTSDFLL